MIKLAICIPTYNRARFLPETLSSIVCQASNDVEIVVSDNASTDNTEEVVRGFQQSFSRLKYYRWPKNMGADLNYLKVIELSVSEYCWFLGSDDVLKDGAIRRIIDEIKYGHDIYLCNRTLCDYNLTPCRDDLFLCPEIGDQLFNLSDNNDMIYYLNSSCSLGGLFSYLSSIIFRREKWAQVEYDDIFLQSAYSHVFMLMSFINKGCNLKYIKDTLVYCRGNNDSFAEHGVVRRIMLDVDGYLLLAEKLFPTDNDVKKAFLAAVRRSPRYYRKVISIRRRADNLEWETIRPRLEKLGCNGLALSIVGMVRPTIWNLLYRIIELSDYFKRD